MKKTIFSILISLLFISLNSCGGKNSSEQKEIVIKPMTTNVSGDLGMCFEVVDRSYKATEGWANGIVTIEIKRTNEPLPFSLDCQEIVSYSTTMFDANIQVGFGIEFLDEDGNILDKVSASASGLSASYAPDEAVDLVRLRSGESGSIRFTINNNAKDAVSFRMSSAYKSNDASENRSSSISSPLEKYVSIKGTQLRLRLGPSTDYEMLKDANGKTVYINTGDVFPCLGEEGDFYKINYQGKELYVSKQYADITDNSASNTRSTISDDDTNDSNDDFDSYDTPAAASSGSEDWDQLLNSYEEYVEKYIKYLKKAAKGDLSALSEYPALMEKAQEYSEKLSKAHGELSTRQIMRMNEINAKMLKAASEEMRNN